MILLYCCQKWPMRVENIKKLSSFEIIYHLFKTFCARRMITYTFFQISLAIHHHHKHSFAGQGDSSSFVAHRMSWHIFRSFLSPVIDGAKSEVDQQYMNVDENRNGSITTEDGIGSLESSYRSSGLKKIWEKEKET